MHVFEPKKCFSNIRKLLKTRFLWKINSRQIPKTWRKFNTLEVTVLLTFVVLQHIKGDANI